MKANVQTRIADTRDLRNFLLSRMIDLVEGRIDHLEAKAIVDFSQQVYNTLNIELKAVTLLNRQPDTLKFIDHGD